MLIERQKDSIKKIRIYILSQTIHFLFSKLMMDKLLQELAKKICGVFIKLIIDERFYVLKLISII